MGLAHHAALLLSGRIAANGKVVVAQHMASAHNSPAVLAIYKTAPKKFFCLVLGAAGAAAAPRFRNGAQRVISVPFFQLDREEPQQTQDVLLNDRALVILRLREVEPRCDLLD